MELLPGCCNELCQAGVTYMHVPGHGWWYAVTVVEDYSRDLLACHYPWNHTAAEVNRTLGIACAEVQRLHGGFEKVPLLVTDNGSSFMARQFQEQILGLFGHVRIAYRAPAQLGLLERFHQTLKRCIGACMTVRSMREPVSTSFASAITRCVPTGHWFR